VRKLLVAVFGLTAIFLLLAACGGGGASGPSGFTPLLNAGGDQESIPPAEGEEALEAVDVEPPQVAEGAGEIGGIVADYVGMPIPDLEIYLNSTGNVVSSTDDSGEFLASGVASGDHNLAIGIEGIEVASFDISYDEALPLNVALSPGGARTVSEYADFGALWGIVTDLEGAPVEDVKVLVFNSDGFFLFTLTGPEGGYEFARIPVGEYRLLGFKRGYRTYVGEVAIHAGETTRHDFVMRGYEIGRVIGTVYDEEGNTLPRTHVFLLYREREDDDRNPPAFHTMTGAEGHYAFNDVPAGGADMLAYKPGYQPADAEVVVPPLGFIVQDFVLHGYPPPPPPPPDYAILTGHVHSGEDHPIGGALVELIHGDDYFATESNDDGFYRFEELPVGEYIFEVSAEGYESIRGELRLLPGHNIRHFYLPPLHPPMGCVFGMVWRMFEGEEEPVPGASMLLFHGEPGENNPPIREGHSNEDGRYCFEELPPSGDLPYVVYARKWFGEVKWEGARDFHLAPGEEKQVCVQIFPPEPPPQFGNVHGIVWRMIEGHDEHVPGALVLLFHGEPCEQNPPIRETHSNDNGFYGFPELPPSGDKPYFVVAKKEYGDGIWQGMKHFFLQSGENKEVHVQIFPPEPPPDFGAIFGKIWRETEGGEEYVGGALVLLFHGEPGEGNTPIRETHSNDNGDYCFEEVPPSGEVPYFLIAKKWYGEDLWVGDAHTSLAPGEEKRICIRLYPPWPGEYGSVRGYVWRMIEENEEHVPGALVLLFHGEPSPENRPIGETHSNDNGAYFFEELPPSGEVPYFVVAKKEFDNGLWQGWKNFHLAPNEDKVVHIQIFPPEPPDGTIGGHIYRQDPEHPDGPPLSVPGAAVKLYHGNPEGQEPIRTTESNEQGIYHFFELPPSGDIPYVVVAHKWIQEVYYYGLEDTHLGEGEFKELHVWIWPED
jgi:hypothetical protein